MKKIFIIFSMMIFFLSSPMLNFRITTPALATDPSPTPKPTPTDEKKLARLKRKGPKKINKLLKALKPLSNVLQRHKGRLLNDTFNSIDTSIEQTNKTLRDLKKAVKESQSYETIIQRYNETLDTIRVRPVFIPKTEALIRLGVLRKSMIRIDKRITNLDKKMAKKVNDDSPESTAAKEALTKAKQGRTDFNTQMDDFELIYLGSITGSAYSANKEAIVEKVLKIPDQLTEIKKKAIEAHKLIRNANKAIIALENTTEATPSPTP